MDTAEELLSAWMDMTVRVRGNRILRELSSNEIMVCSFLYRDGRETGLTTSQLGDRLRLLKSQMHKVLADLERKGLIARRQDPQDRRKMYVYLRDEGLKLYLQEHEQIIRLIRPVVASLGGEKTAELTQMLRQATDILEKAQKETDT